MRSDKYDKNERGLRSDGRDELSNNASKSIPSKYAGRELTPEQRRYLEIVEQERRKNNAQPQSAPPQAVDKRQKKVKKKQQKKRSKGKTAFKSIVIILLCLVALVAAYFFKLTSNLDYVAHGKSEFDINSTVADDLKGYRNIAILGSDARKGEGYDGSRTDAVIIMRIHKTSGKVQLISVMRDSYLEIEDADGQMKLDKLTHAHAFGGGVDTCKALNRNLDLNISEFVIFNWQAVADMVDELGGIEVDIKKKELNDLNKYGPETAENVGKSYTPIHETGEQTIDGATAATYCRIRKTSGGDPDRGSRMKIVMQAVMKKATHSGIGKINSMATTVFPEVRTNMARLDILTALVSAPRYKFVKSQSWPKTYYGGILGDGVWYAVPRTLETQVERLHKKSFGQDNYQLSQGATEINNRIIQTTGIY